MLKIGVGRFPTYNDDQRCKILNAYYKALRQVFPSEFEISNSVFFKTIGFGGTHGTYFRSRLTSLRANQRVKDRAFHKDVQGNRDFDFGQWQELSSSGAEIAAAEALRDRRCDTQPMPLACDHRAR